MGEGVGTVGRLECWVTCEYGMQMLAHYPYLNKNWCYCGRKCPSPSGQWGEGPEEGPSPQRRGPSGPIHGAGALLKAPALWMGLEGGREGGKGEGWVEGRLEGAKKERRGDAKREEFFFPSCVHEMGTCTHERVSNSTHVFRAGPGMSCIHVLVQGRCI